MMTLEQRQARWEEEQAAAAEAERMFEERARLEFAVTYCQALVDKAARELSAFEARLPRARPSSFVVRCATSRDARVLAVRKR